MNTPTRILPVLSTLALLAGACTDETTDPGAQSFRDTWTCDDCNGNSPRANDFPVPELQLDGEPNNDGIRLLGIVSPLNTVFDLALDGDDIHAIDANGDTVAWGEDLVGWRLWLRNASDVNEYIYIRGFHKGVPGLTKYGLKISAYAMAYKDPLHSGQFLNLCPDVLDDPDAYAITLIAGETYDRDEVKVHPIQRRWFTLACANEAVYKMKAMGYGPNTTLFGSTTHSTLTDRIATLKMITATYCPDNKPYTQQGQAVYWKSIHGGVDNYPDDLGNVQAEALWDHSGALCLTNPRFVDRSIVPCAEDLQECEDFVPNGPFVWKTGIPVPPPEETTTATTTE